MNRLQLRRFGAASLVCASALACGYQQPKRLQQLPVPAGSTLAMTRPVALQVTTTNASLPPGTVGTLEVRRQDGKVIFEGPVFASLGLTSHLVVPTSHSKMVAVLRVHGKPDAMLTLGVSNTTTAKFE